MSPLEALAEPHRRAIVELLLRGDFTVGEIGGALAMRQPSASKHVKVLSEAGLVHVRADGARRVVRLRPEPLMELDRWLAPFRAAWALRLDALERHLDTMETE